MRNRSVLHISLALTGIAAWLLFILACSGWSSWSPDGSQVVFTYCNDDCTSCSVALYGIKDGKTRTLYTHSLPKKDDGPWLSAQWKQDGKSVLAFVHQSSDVEILEISTAGEPARKIATVEYADASRYSAPVPELFGSLYVASHPVTRVDLADGAVHTLTDEYPEIYLAPWKNERLLYSKEINVEGASRLEFGEVDPQTLAQNRLFDIPNPDRDIEELRFQTISAEPMGSRFAVVSVNGVRDRILLYDQHGFERALDAKLPFARYHIGNLQWAPDGNSLYASFMHRLDNGLAEWAVAEISLDSGRTRVLPIAQFKAGNYKDFSEGFSMYLQVSLSPDGRTLAVNTMYVPDQVWPAQRGLYLLDVDGRKVTRIPLSAFTKPTSH